MKDVPCVMDFTSPREGKTYLFAYGPGFVVDIYGPLAGIAEFSPTGIVDKGDGEKVAYMADANHWSFYSNPTVYHKVTVYLETRKQRYPLCRLDMLGDPDCKFGTWRARGEGWTRTEWRGLVDTLRYLEDMLWSVYEISATDDGFIQDEELFNKVAHVIEAGPEELIPWLYPELERIDDTILSLLI